MERGKLAAAEQEMLRTGRQETGLPSAPPLSQPGLASLALAHSTWPRAQGKHGGQTTFWTPQNVTTTKGRKTRFEELFWKGGPGRDMSSNAGHCIFDFKYLNSLKYLKYLKSIKNKMC